MSNICKSTFVCLLMAQAILAITIGSTSPSIIESNGKSKDLKVEETRERDPPAEYYRGGSAFYADRYKDKYGDRYNNFVTQPGSTSSYDTQSQQQQQQQQRYPYTQPSYSSYSTGGNNKYKYPASTFGPSTVGGSSGSGGYYLQGGGIYEQPYTTKTPLHYGLAQTVDIPAYPNYLSGTPYGGSSGTTGLDYGQNGYGNGGQPSSFFGKDIKSILPFAGAALLGIAAALVVNPGLLQSISGRVGGALGHGNGGYSTGSYGGSSGGYGNSGYGNSGYGHGSYAHHHGRKRRAAAEKFAQNLAYTQSKRN